MQLLDGSRRPRIWPRGPSEVNIWRRGHFHIRGVHFSGPLNNFRAPLCRRLQRRPRQRRQGCADGLPICPRCRRAIEHDNVFGESGELYSHKYTLQILGPRASFSNEIGVLAGYIMHDGVTPPEYIHCGDCHIRHCAHVVPVDLNDGITLIDR